MRETLLLVEKEDHSLAFLDLASGLVSARVGLPAFPHELVVDARRGHALISHYGVISSAYDGPGGHTVIVVDCARRSVVGQLDCGPHNRIHGIKQDGYGRVYALSEASALLLVFERALGAGRPVAEIPTGGLKSHLFAVCKDGRAAFVTNLLSGTVTKVFPAEPHREPISLATGLRPEGICLSGDERRLFVTNRGSNTVAAVIVEPFTIESVAQVRPDPLRIYPVGSDMLLLVFHEGSGVSLMSGDLSREIAFLPLAGRPTAACLSPDETHAFLSVGPALSMELELATFSIRATRETGRGPDACHVLVEPYD